MPYQRQKRPCARSCVMCVITFWFVNFSSFSLRLDVVVLLCSACSYLFLIFVLARPSFMLWSRPFHCLPTFFDILADSNVTRSKFPLQTWIRLCCIRSVAVSSAQRRDHSEEVVISCLKTWINAFTRSPTSFVRNKRQNGYFSERLITDEK